MNKQEIYYKFIFPTYDSLSVSDDGNNFVPDSDGKDQKGEVRALCNKCPERVITYDQLTATSPISMYADGNNGWSADKKVAIKSYIDKYLTIPKYFNLRNYEDSIPTQRLGMSLMVSDTPEIGGDYSNYTKFTVGSKIVYCAVMVSSGDFFYNFCLPNEVIEKSGLRDEVVKPAKYADGISGNSSLRRFHSNWCFNSEEKSKSQYPLTAAQVGQEKRVFVQHYFKDDYHYSLQTSGNIFYYANFTDKLGNVYSPFDENVHCVDTSNSSVDELGNTYKGYYLPPRDCVRYYYYGNDKSNTLTINTFDSLSNAPNGAQSNTKEIRVVEKADDYIEDLKHDFIDLEATRRILYFNEDDPTATLTLKYDGSVRNIHPTRDIPRIVDETKTGTDTALSYEPPDEYLNKGYTYTYNNYSLDSTLSVDTTGTPPLQIPYNLLRYCLNDRPPFTDCETVLVMWVADRDPLAKKSDGVTDVISYGDVAALHGLNWQQYAIPISCRCCYKQPVNEKKFSNERFLVSYPHQWVIGSQGPESTYRYHTRCSEAYDKNVFKEVLYLRDLIAYSNDYIIAYQNTGVKYHKKGFDIQGYLFKNYENHFVKLYVPKTFNQPSNDGHTDPEASGLSMNRQGQFYYIRVNQKDSTGNDIFYINTEGYPNTQTSGINSRRICICKPGTTDTFEPSEHIYRLNAKNEKWDPKATPFVKPLTKVSILGEEKDFGFDDLTYHDKYGYNDWQINDSYLIALFNKPTDLQEKSNVLLTLGSSDGKGEELYARLNDVSNTTQWGEDLYISSLGVTQYNPVLINSVFHGGGQSMICSLGILDNYIKLDGAVYGSETNQVIVGFKNMLDFHQEDLYHFRYDTATKTYYPVTVQYDYETKQLTETKLSGFTCTAYIMPYPKS